MLTRILTALVGIPALLFFIYMGGAWFAFMVAVLAVMGGLEFYRMADGKQRILLVPMLLGILLMLGGCYLNVPNWASVALLFTLCIVSFCAIIRYPDFSVEDIAVNIFAVIYIGWTMAHLIAFDALGDGRLYILYLFVGIWGSDSGAYFVGIALGKHRLCPAVSPKKSVEGSVGGLLTAALLLAALNAYFHMVPMVAAICIGLAISVVGQIGDLVESLIKRHYGVKDSGNLIPGHGGVLDRFDSIMLAAPVMYYSFLLVFMMYIQ